MIQNARVVTDEQVMDRGWVLVERGLIVDIGAGTAPGGRCGTSIVDADGDWLMPGFVDVHVHGGGGGSFDGRTDGALAAARFHARHGTTSLLAGMATAPWAHMRDDVAELAALVERAADPASGARILGTFLEGPFISTARKGAHERSLIRTPTHQDVLDIVGQGRGTVKVVTVAPEVTNGMDAVTWLTGAGVAVSIGHTDAAGDALCAGVDAGATCLTHTFNAMRAPRHRDPAVFQVLTDRATWCEVVCDGLHLDPVYVRLLRQLVGQERLVLVTDAVTWAGQPDGRYAWGERSVVVDGGRVYLEGTDTLAGSCLTMGAAVQNYAAFTGAGPVELAKVSATNAAMRLGVADRIGRIRPGFLADLVTLSPDYHVRGVMRDGVWLRHPSDTSGG